MNSARRAPPLRKGSASLKPSSNPAAFSLHTTAACYPLFGQGRFHDAIPRLERSLALWHASDVAAWYHQSAGALGYAYAMTGRLTEAFPLLERAVERARHVDRRNETRVLGYLVEAYWHAGRLGDAHIAAGRALDLSCERGERGAEAWVLRLLGEIHAHREPPEVEQAEAHYRQALSLAEELGMRPLQAHCHRGLGTLYAATGQREQARTALSTAIEMYRDMEMTLLAPADRGGPGTGGGPVMDYEAVLAQALTLLQREQRLSYRVLKLPPPAR